MNKLARFLIFFTCVVIINCNLFTDYIAKYKIKIPNRATRIKYRTQFYKTRSEVIKFNLQKGNSFKQAINQFAHLTVNQVAQEKFGLKLILFSNTTKKPTPISSGRAKCGYVDWRNNGSVTAIKDQGVCGNCYIFSAVASIESQILMKYRKNYSLSEQYAMDCMSSYFKIGNNACNGGMPDYIYMLTINKGGLPLTEDYPYLGYDQNTCSTNGTMITQAKIRSYTSLSPASNEDQIACMLLHKGPVSVALFVNTTLLRYGGGIYNDIESCSDDAIPNHSVLLVGYGRDAATNVEYFIIKNSWGTDYGENGYIRFKKGSALCQILSLVEQPSIV